MAYETITVDVDNHVALITLNRPDALNALNDALLGELAKALKGAQENDKVRCIVITGSEKAFAAGADIAMMRDQSFVDVFMGDLFTPETDHQQRLNDYARRMIELRGQLRNEADAFLSDFLP